MHINKCDLCKTEVGGNISYFHVSKNAPFGGNDICRDCGKPIEQFLVKNGLIEREGKTRSKKA